MGLGKTGGKTAAAFLRRAIGPVNYRRYQLLSRMGKVTPRDVAYAKSKRFERANVAPPKGNTVFMADVKTSINEAANSWIHVILQFGVLGGTYLTWIFRPSLNTEGSKCVNHEDVQKGIEAVVRGGTRDALKEEATQKVIKNVMYSAALEAVESTN